MKAMIFAAGIGSRLKPFTLAHPKALVKVGGIPILQRVIMNIAHAGIKDIVVNVHHFAPQIVDFLKEHDNFGLNISISDESGCLLDTGGGFLAAEPLLRQGDRAEQILLHNADILTDLPLDRMIDRHNATGADVTLLCSRRNSSRTLYFNNADGKLAGWENISRGEYRPDGFRPDMNVDPSPFDGVHIVSSRIFPYLRQYSLHAGDNPGGKDVFSIIPFYLANLNNLDIRRYMLPDDCHWFDVGSADKLAVAEEFIATKL